MLDIDDLPNPNRLRRLGRAKEKPGVVTDMNSMVDMAFLLLTFFMLSTTMYRPRGLEIAFPVPDDTETRVKEVQAVKASQALTLIAMPESKLYYYRGLPEASSIKSLSYGKAGLRTLLQKFIQETPKAVVLLKPHPDCVFEDLVTLLDEMNISRVPRYAIDKASEEELQIMRSAGIPVPNP